MFEWPLHAVKDAAQQSWPQNSHLRRCAGGVKRSAWRQAGGIFIDLNGDRWSISAITSPSSPS